MIKLYFANSSFYITCLFLYFIGGANIPKSKMGTSTGRLRDPDAVHPQNKTIGRSKNVRQTSPKQVF